MYSPLRHIPALFYKRRPIQLTYFVTRRCNAHCPYCFYLASNDSSQTSDTELSLDEIQQIASKLGSLLWLAFSGGEIFLRKDLAEISRTFYQNNQPCIMLYPTNGMQPKRISHCIEQILSECPKSIIVVKLSIDGIGVQHDRLRNTPHSFENTLQTFEHLSPLLEKYPNLELGFNTVFCSENQHDMDNIINFVAGLDHAPLHTLSMVRGNLSEPRYKDVDLQKYRQASDKLANNMKNRISSLYHFTGARIKAAQDVLQRRLIYATLLHKKSQLPCYAGQLNLVLRENGEVYPCETLSGSYGNVRNYNYDLHRIIKTEKANNINTRIKKGSCHCTHECYMMTNALFNPKILPALTKEFIHMLN